MKQSRILIVDDHPMVRDWLTAMINREADLVVVGEAGSATEALERVAADLPDLAIVDLTMKDSHGTELIRELAERYSQLPMLVVSMHDESLYGERAIRAGAKGYITKQEAAGAIRDAIRRVLSGQYHLSDALAAKMIRAAAGRTTATTAELSDRQLVVIRLLGGGMSTTQIALEMKLSIKTVEGYIARIKKKLNVASAGELLKYAIELNKEHGTYPPLCPFG